MSIAGFPLAWHKATQGTSVQWIGGQLTRIPGGVTVSIPQDKAAELAQTTRDILAWNTVGVRALRSYCGSVSFVAGLVPTLRPFLTMVWGALTSASGGVAIEETSHNVRSSNATSSKARKRGLPCHLVHTKQCAHALSWLLAFLSRQRGSISRSFTYKPDKDSWLTIATDASPWGFGGVLVRGTEIVSWFADTPSPQDLVTLQSEIGDPAYNTVWEALAILVAVRLWRQPSHLGISLELKSDSMASLQILFKLSSTSDALNLIARELALDTAELSAPLELFTHIPGVSNIIPDHLSRLHAPNAHGFPDCLRGIPEAKVHPRDGSFWITLENPL